MDTSMEVVTASASAAMAKTTQAIMRVPSSVPRLPALPSRPLVVAPEHYRDLTFVLEHLLAVNA
jgi:hypothetical protein